MEDQSTLQQPWSECSVKHSLAEQDGSESLEGVHRESLREDVRDHVLGAAVGELQQCALIQLFSTKCDPRDPRIRVEGSCEGSIEGSQ